MRHHAWTAKTAELLFEIAKSSSRLQSCYLRLQSLIPDCRVFPKHVLACQEAPFLLPSAQNSFRNKKKDDNKKRGAANVGEEKKDAPKQDAEDEDVLEEEQEIAQSGEVADDEEVTEEETDKQPERTRPRRKSSSSKSKAKAKGKAKPKAKPEAKPKAKSETKVKQKAVSEKPSEPEVSQKKQKKRGHQRELPTFETCFIVPYASRKEAGLKLKPAYITEGGPTQALSPESENELLAWSESDHIWDSIVLKC